MDSYLNIHVHSPQEHANILAVNAVCIQSSVHTHIPQTISSIGLHPWHISQYLDSFSKNDILQRIENTLSENLRKHKTIKFIGEIGLDKAIVCSIELQKAVFISQLQIAQQHHLPVIIHCVRAYNEIVEIIKSYKITIPIIFHGFNSSVQMAQQLTAKGFYIALGFDLLNNNVLHFNNLLQQLPLSNIVFETDMHPNERIIDVYTHAQLQTNYDFTTAINLSNFNL